MPLKITFQESIHTFQIDFNRHVSNVVYIQWVTTPAPKGAGFSGDPAQRRG